MDQDKMSNIYKGSSIDASYQVSVHLAEGLQRRRLKCEKLTDDGRQTTDERTPSDGKSSHCLWQGELIRTSLTSTMRFHLLLQYKRSEQNSQCLGFILEEVNIRHNVFITMFMQ